MAADTGYRIINGQGANEVNATVALKKGVTYSLNTEFGLSNSKGNVKLSVQDANGIPLKFETGAIGNAIKHRDIIEARMAARQPHTP